MANYYGVPVEQIQQSIAGQQGGEANIANNLRTRKAVEAIVKHAKLTEGEWVDPSQAQPEAETSEEEKPKGKTKKAKAETEETTETEEKPKKKSAKKEK